MARSYNFEFLLSAPVTRDEVSAWLQREGVADEDTLPFELAFAGKSYITFAGGYTATTGQAIATYLPRFRDWLTARGIEMYFLEGDFVPTGFWRYDPREPR